MNMIRMFLACAILGINTTVFALSLGMRVGDINGTNTLYDVTEAMTNLVSQSDLKNLDTSYKWFGNITNENQSVQYVSLTNASPTSLIIDLPQSGETKDWIVYVTSVANVTLKLPEITWWASDSSVFDDILPNVPTAFYFTQVASNIFVIGRQEVQPVSLPIKNIAPRARQPLLLNSDMIRRDVRGAIGGNGFCRPINEGKSLAYAPCMFPPNPAVPTETEYNAHGYYRNAIQPPVIPSGKIVASKTYVIDGNEVVAQYEYEDAPPVIRMFPRGRLESALFEAGYLDAVDAYIDSQTITNKLGNTMPLRRLYNSTNFIREDSQYFVQARASLKSSLGLTDDEIETILSSVEGYDGSR